MTLLTLLTSIFAYDYHKKPDFSFPVSVVYLRGQEITSDRKAKDESHDNRQKISPIYRGMR